MKQEADCAELRTFVLRGLSKANRMAVCYTLALMSVACASNQEKAVNAVLAFAKRAPFTIAAPTEKTYYPSVAIADSMLVAYNRLFQYFDPRDSTRASLYAALPGEILETLPVIEVLSVSSKPLKSDTIAVTAVFKRPAKELFQKTVLGFVYHDSVKATPEQKKRFDEELRRVSADVFPTSEGWYRDSTAKYFSNVVLECEASRGEAVTREDSYLLTDNLGLHEPSHEICGWFIPEKAAEWRRVRPNRYRVRLLATFGFDSLAGDWVEVTR